MKAAKASDYWRRLTYRPPVLSIDQFIIRGIRGLATETLSARNSINILCGANGTGKSTILEALHLALKGVRPQLHFSNNLRYNSAMLHAQVRLDATSLSCRYESSTHIEGLPAEVEVLWLNPGSLSGLLQRDFSQTVNFEEFLAGSPERQFTSAELREISYLVGRDYSRVTVTEIEDTSGFEGLDVVPFFSVTTEGVTYRSEEMGIGEHALFLLFWYTRRISERSLLLIEEIETHISFRSQIHVLNDLARQSLERKISVILTTHSPAILERVPPDYIKLCHRYNGQIWIKESPSEMELAQALGVRPKRAGVCLVEDAAAKAFLIALFQLLRRECALAFEVVVAGSTSDIDTALRVFPKVSEWLKIVGVYDAGFEIPDTAKHATINLPGSHSPEIEVLPAVRDNLPLFAQAVGVPEDGVRAALASLAGFDEHDWFAELVRLLGVNYETGMRAAVSTWLANRDNEQAAQTFVKTFGPLQ